MVCMSLYLSSIVCCRSVIAGVNSVSHGGSVAVLDVMEDGDRVGVHIALITPVSVGSWSARRVSGGGSRHISLVRPAP